MAVTPFTNFTQSGNYNVNAAYYIGHYNGLIMEGKFKTPTDYANNAVCYIVVGKEGPNGNATEFQANDGYGVGLTSGDGNTFNLFIVDSGLVTEEFIVADDITFFDVTANGVLSASSKEIRPDVEYDFEMSIDLNNKLEFRIWESTGSRPVNPDIYTGSRENLSSKGNYWGFFAPNTDGALFYFKDVEIFRNAEDYAIQSFKLRAWSGIENEGALINVISSGNGYDPSDNSVLPGVDIGLYKPNGIEDEKVDYLAIPGHNSSGLVEINGEILGANISDYLWTDEFDRQFVWVVVKTKGQQIPGDDTKRASLSVDYIAMTSLISEQIHTGGKQDIYVWAPDNFVTNSITFTVASNPYFLSTSNGEFPIITYNLVRDNGVLLNEGVDYSITAVDSSKRWSHEESFQITIDDNFFLESGGTQTNPTPITLKLVYETYPNIKNITDFLNLPENRLGSVNNLVKVKPPVLISFTKLEYAGDVAEETIISGLIQKFNFEWSSVTAQSLIQYLLSIGVEFVDPNILIDVDQWDWTGTKIESRGIQLDSIGITSPERSHFYIKPDNFEGLLKLG